MKHRGRVFKLDLKRAIILEDARRIHARKKPINNLWQLSQLMCCTYDSDYEADKLYKLLWRAQCKGYSSHGLSTDFKPIINHLCELLSIKERDLIIDITN
nr:hypothetical protein [uncultured Allomuricauda sp.]